MGARPARRPLPGPRRRRRRRGTRPTCWCSPRWAPPSAGDWPPGAGSATPSPSPSRPRWPPAGPRSSTSARRSTTRSQAQAWLAGAGEADLEAGLAVLNRALHCFRVITADPYLHPVGRAQALVARIGFGAGEEVADGRVDRRAKELTGRPRAGSGARASSHRRPAWRRCWGPASRRWPARSWPCARVWTSTRGAPREAALQLLVALDAALAELAAGPRAAELAGRLERAARPARAGRRRGPGGAVGPARRGPHRGGRRSRWGAWRRRCARGRRRRGPRRSPAPGRRGPRRSPPSRRPRPRDTGRRRARHRGSSPG